jgi:putative hydrolase of the HAD superfamily
MTLNFTLFDLDGTLYPADSGLLQEIGQRIQLWLCERLRLSWEEAITVRSDYYFRYGTTLSGLIAEHDIDVNDYLDFVHDISLERYLHPNPALISMLDRLALRKVVYTNASAGYSWRVLRALDIGDHFERVISIEDVGLRNKIYIDAYERALALLDARADQCIMIEDTPRNLRVAKALGMTTVLVRAPETESNTDGSESADFTIADVLDVGKIVEALLKS